MGNPNITFGFTSPNVLDMNFVFTMTKYCWLEHNKMKNAGWNRVWILKVNSYNPYNENVSGDNVAINCVLQEEGCMGPENGSASDNNS